MKAQFALDFCVLLFSIGVFMMNIALTGHALINGIKSYLARALQNKMNLFVDKFLSANGCTVWPLQETARVEFDSALL